MKHSLLQKLLGSFLFLLFLVFGGPALHAQVVTSGTDFRFTLLQNFVQQGPIGLRVYISSVPGSTGTVSVPGIGFSQNFNCPANGVVFVQLPAGAEPNQSGVIENRAIRVVSQNPVSVYSLNAADNTTDGTMVMPVNTLGFDYYVMSYREQGFNRSQSQFSFCAVMPGTQIEFTPSAPTINGFPAGVPQVVTLNPGQMMQVVSDRGDLTGSRVRVLGNNCRFPIAVFGGNQCTNVGPCGTCDHLYEMMSPSPSLGRQYVYVPTRPGLVNDVIRVMAVQAGTIVTVNGVPRPPLNAGQFFTVDAATLNQSSTSILSNNPIAVASFAKGGGCRNQIGDPMMIMLTPTDVLGVTTVNMTTVDVAPPNTHYINLVTASANTANITVSPPPINCEPWTPVPGLPLLSTRRCEISAGNVNVNSSGTGFNVYQYGWGTRDSYGMAGAGLLNPNPIGMAGSIAFTDSICVSRNKRFIALSNGAPINLSWDWGDGSPIEAGPANTHTTLNHVYAACGRYRIRVEYSTQNGSFCAERWVNAWATPSADLGNFQGQICPGQRADIPVSLSGTCNGRFPGGQQNGVVPFQLIYSVNGVNQPPVVFNSDSLLIIQTPPINACTDIRLVSVRNAYLPWNGARCETFLDEAITVCPENLQLTASAQPTSVCAGQSTTLTAAGGANYNWTWPGFSRAGNPITVSPTVTTTYTVTGSVGNCTATAAVTVTVVPGPVNPRVTPQNAVFCRGQQNACFTVTHPDPNAIFEWEDGFVGANRCIPVPNVGNFITPRVQVRVNGCVSGRTFTPYTVQDLPPVNPTPAQGAVCSGGTFFFSIPNNQIQPGDQFFWRDEKTGILTGPSVNYTTPALVSNLVDIVNGYPSPARFCVLRRNTNSPGCESTCTSFTVDIILAPVPQGRITPNPICPNQLSELEVTGPNFFGVRFSWFDAPVGGNLLFSNLQVGDRRPIGPFANSGTYTYYLQSNIGNCISARVPVTLTVNPGSIAGTITGNNTICQGGSTTLTVNGFSGNILRWEFSEDNFATVQAINSNSATLTFNNISRATCYRVVVRNGNCPAATSLPFCVVVDNTPVPGSINLSGQTICSGTAAAPITLTGFSGNITWERSTDCATFTTTNNTNATLNIGILTQNTCFRARVSRGVCNPVFSNVHTVTVSNPPQGGSVTTGTPRVCNNGSATFTLTGNGGNVIRWESSIDNFVNNIVTINNNTSTLTVLNVTQSTCYRAVVSDNICPPVNSGSACVTVVTPPVAGTILRPDVTLCQGNVVGSIVLSGSQGSIIWESSRNCPAFTNPTTINNTTATLSVGALTTTTCFRARVINAPCPDVTSNIFTATILPSQPGTVNASQTVCRGTDPAPLNLSGHSGDILRWESSVNGFVSSVTINNTNATYQPSGLTTLTCFRAVVFNPQSNCTAPSVPSCIRVDQPSVGGTVTAVRNPICVGATTQLALNGNTGTILRWESASDVNFTAPVTINHTLASYTTQPINQITFFRAVVQSGVCPPAFSVPVQISVTPNTQRGTLTAPQTLCDNNPGGAAALNLTGLTGSVIRWESSTDNFASFTTIQFQAVSYRPLIVTRTTQFRVYVSTPDCGLAYTDPVTITVIPASSQGGTVNGDRTVCRSSNSGTLTLSGQTGTILGWDFSVNGGPFAPVLPVNATSTLNFSNLTQTTLYKVRVSGICGTVNSTVVTVRVAADPIGGNLFFNQTVCSGNTGSTLLLTAYSGRITRWESSTDNGTNWNTLAGTMQLFNPGVITRTTLFRARVESECRGTYSNAITITVPNGSAGILAQDMTICGTPASGTLTLTGYTGTVAAWEGSVDNFITIQPFNIQTPFFNFQNVTTTTRYRAKVNIGGCILNSNSVQVTVLPNLSAGFVGPDQTVCAGTNPANLVLEGYSGEIIRWESSTDCFASQITTLNHTQGTYTAQNLTQTTCYRAVIFYPQCGELASLPAKITVIPIAFGGSVTADQTVCSSQPVSMLTLTGYTGNVVRWESSEDGFNTITTLSGMTDTYQPPTLLRTTAFRAVVSTGSCGVMVSQPATITVFGTPAGGTVSAAQTVCSGGTPEPLTLSGFTGNVLFWESSTDNFVTVATLNVQSPVLVLGGHVSRRCYRAVVGSGGCGTARSSSVCISTVNPPVGGFIITSQTVCLGQNPNALILTGYSGVIAEWQSSTDNFTTFNVINNVSPVLNPGILAQTTAFRVRVVNPPCAEVLSAVATITVNSNSTVPGTLSSNISVCEGNSAPLTLNLTGHIGSILRWESSDNNFQSFNVISNNLPTYTFAPPVRTTQYRVLVQSAGCPIQVSNVVTVTVVPRSLGGILSRVGGVQGNCGSNTGTIQLNNFVGTIAYWQSSTDGGLTWTDIVWDLNRYDYTISVPTLFRVAVTNPNCGLMFSNPIETAPALGLTTDAYRECDGTGKIVAAGFGGSPGYTYSLSPAAGVQSAAGVFTGLPAGTYTVTVRDRFNCAATSTVAVPLGVSAPRILNLTGTGGNNGVRIAWEGVQPGGNAVEYEVSYRPEGGSLWTSVPAGQATDLTLNDLLPNTRYEFRVRVRCLPGTIWSAWSPVSVFGTLTREMISEKEVLQVSLYPNPATEFVNIGCTPGKTLRIEIFTANGANVYSQTRTFGAIGSETETLEIKELSAGIYLFKFTDENGFISVQKLVISR